MCCCDVVIWILKKCADTICSFGTGSTVPFWHHWKGPLSINGNEVAVCLYRMVTQEIKQKGRIFSPVLGLAPQHQSGRDCS